MPKAALEVQLLVGPSIGRSMMFVKKWPLEYQKVIKTYLPTYLCDSSDSSNSSDSCDSCDSSDSIDISDSSYQTTLWLKFSYYNFFY